jgi:hypothetical protein
MTQSEDSAALINGNVIAVAFVFMENVSAKGSWRRASGVYTIPLKVEVVG